MVGHGLHPNTHTSIVLVHKKQDVGCPSIQEVFKRRSRKAPGWSATSVVHKRTTLWFTWNVWITKEDGYLKRICCRLFIYFIYFFSTYMAKHYLWTSGSDDTSDGGRLCLNHVFRSHTHSMYYRRYLRSFTLRIQMQPWCVSDCASSRTLFPFPTENNRKRVECARGQFCDLALFNAEML